jgi:hypothetical protein
MTMNRNDFVFDDISRILASSIPRRQALDLSQAELVALSSAQCGPVDSRMQAHSTSARRFARQTTTVLIRRSANAAPLAVLTV